MLYQNSTAVLGERPGTDFIIGNTYSVKKGIAPLRTRYGARAELDTELLFGEPVTVLAHRKGYLRVRAELDHKEGYIPATALANKRFRPTHRVWVPHVVTSKTRPVQSVATLDLPMNALVRVMETPDKFSRLSVGGWVNHSCLKPIGEFETDFVEVALRFRGRPYKWGGRTALGLDCSALIQVSLQACGYKNVPRDSGPQSRELGTQVPDGEFRRGDLLFWKGHAAIVLNRDYLLHAADHTMMVVMEPIKTVLTRRRKEESPDKQEITCVRRLPDYAERLVRRGL